LLNKNLRKPEFPKEHKPNKPIIYTFCFYQKMTDEIADTIKSENKANIDFIKSGRT